MKKTRVTTMSEIQAWSPRAPVVRTTANPSADLLLLARAILGKDKGLRGFFLQARKEDKGPSWLRDVIAAPLNVEIEGHSFEDVLGVCQYLADEYTQLPEGYCLVDTRTGKVAAVISEDDLMDPGLLPRESGEMGQALRRLLPSKEVAITTYYHEQEHAERVIGQLIEQVSGNVTISRNDPSLRIVTREGRTDIARELSEDDPIELLRRAGGTAGAFLRHVTLFSEGTDLSRGTLHPLDGTAVYRSQMNMTDLLATNLRYNRLGSLRATAPQGWVRSICVELSRAAHKRSRSVPVDIGDYSIEELDLHDLWILDPDTYVEFKRMGVKVPLMPVEGASPLAIKGHIGQLFVDKGYEVQTREQFKTWEVTATIPYKLHVTDWESIWAAPIIGVSAHTEVVH